MKLRCSSLPRIAACPASAEAPLVSVVDEWNEAGAVGTAVHEGLAHWIKTQKFPPLDALCEKHGVKPAEVGWLIRNGRHVWGVYEPLVDLVGVEHHLTGALGEHELSGHLDELGRRKDKPRTAVVIDWKTNRVERDYSRQILGYGSLVFQNAAQINEVIGVIVWLREAEKDGSVPTETLTMTRDNVSLWTEKFLDHLESGEYTNNPETCAFCPKRHACATRSILMRNAVACVSKLDPKAVLTRDDLARIYPQAQAAKRALNEFDKMLKAQVAEAPVSLGNGQELYIQETKTDIIAPRDAATIYGADQVLESCTLSKTKFLDAQTEGAPKRGRKLAKTEIIDTLRNAGAIETRVDKKLAKRKEKT